MKTEVEVLSTPAELTRLSPEKLKNATCVVFDVLRATSTMVTALHHGAREIIVVSEIGEALALHGGSLEILLAGERGGRRIRAEQTGSVDFHLGNSPREFTQERIEGKSIVMTTTNGTRALRSCEGADAVFPGCFLNLAATSEVLRRERAEHLFIVCAGTGEGTSYEDVLGAGALLALLPETEFDRSADECLMAMHLYERAALDLGSAFAATLNGRRLAADAALAGDLAYCAQRDIFTNVVRMTGRFARIEAIH